MEQSEATGMLVHHSQPQTVEKPSNLCLKLERQAIGKRTMREKMFFTYFDIMKQKSNSCAHSPETLAMERRQMVFTHSAKGHQKRVSPCSKAAMALAPPKDPGREGEICCPSTRLHTLRDRAATTGTCGELNTQTKKSHTRQGESITRLGG